MSEYPTKFDELRVDAEDRREADTGALRPGESAGVGYHAGLHNNANGAVNAIEKTLGLKPQGVRATLVERLESIEAAIKLTEGVVPGNLALLTAGRLNLSELPLAAVYNTRGLYICDANDNMAIGSNYRHIEPSLEKAHANVAYGSGTRSPLPEGNLGEVTTGYDNTAIGAGVLVSLTTAHSSTAVGADSLSALTTGINNTAIGAQSAESVTTGEGNIAIGASALHEATTGNSNIAIGVSCLYNNTGSENVGIGAGALQASTGSNNVAIGHEALIKSGASSNNVAIGSKVLQEATTASLNTAVGAEALVKITTGGENLALGKSAMGSATTANTNVALGPNALGAVTIGNGNTAVGYQAGQTELVSGELNVFLGYRAGRKEAGSNKLYIANSETAEPLIWGDFSAKELRLNTTKLGFYGVAPVARHAAITEPAETLAGLKAAVNTVREVLKNVGLTE